MFPVALSVWGVAMTDTNADELAVTFDGKDAALFVLEALYGDHPNNQKMAKIIDDSTRQEVLRARMDEWKRMEREYPTAPYIPDFVWKERLATISQELNGEQSNEL